MVREMRTRDAHEAAYYMANGLRLRAMEAEEHNPKEISCTFVLAGEENLIDALSGEYATGRAVVNVFSFRKCYFDALHQLRRTIREIRAGGEV